MKNIEFYVLSTTKSEKEIVKSVKKFEGNDFLDKPNVISIGFQYVENSSIDVFFTHGEEEEKIDGLKHVRITADGV